MLETEIKSESGKEPEIDKERDNESTLALKLSELETLRLDYLDHEAKFQEASGKRLELQDKLGMKIGVVTATDLSDTERDELEKQYDTVTEMGKIHGEALRELTKDIVEKQSEIKELKRRFLVKSEH